MTFMFPEQDSGYNAKTNLGEQGKLQISYNEAVGQTMSKGKLTYGEMHRVGDVVCGSIEELAELFGIKAE